MTKNKTIEFALVKKLPDVLNGNISAKNTKKKGNKVFLWVIFSEKNIILSDLNIIDENIINENNNPINPSSVDIWR